MPFLSRAGDVNVLYLGSQGVELDEVNPENRFTADWLERMEALVAEAAEQPKTPLVITATGKFFSNGLDVGVVADLSALPAYIERVHALFATVLTVPMPTVAAVNGHAFGAGAMFALCADVRLMRTERGFWSLPEAALGMPFPLGMASLLRTRLPDATATEAMFTSRRYGGADAAAAGIVDAAVDVDELLERASALGVERAPLAGPSLAEIKRNLRRPLLDDLAAPYPRAAS